MIANFWILRYEKHNFDTFSKKTAKSLSKKEVLKCFKESKSTKHYTLQHEIFLCQDDMKAFLIYLSEKI